jgi:flagellar basal-body rod modification protein FlgD
MNSIMGIPAAVSTVDSSSQSSQNNNTVKNPNNDLGEDQFLSLLVTELKNQDPLEPLQNSEFIAQLATFSSLEKLTDIDSILKSKLGVTTPNQGDTPPKV